MTNIVERLRATALDKDNFPRMDSERWFPVGLAKEAADEIERRDEEAKYWKAINNQHVAEIEQLMRKELHYYVATCDLTTKIIEPLPPTFGRDRTPGTWIDPTLPAAREKDDESSDAEIERLRKMLQALWIAYQDDDNFRRVFADLERDYGVSLTGRETGPT